MGLAAILAALSAIESLVPFVQKTMAALKRTGELTPMQAQALTDRMEAAFASDAWQTDAPVPPVNP